MSRNKMNPVQCVNADPKNLSLSKTFGSNQRLLVYTCIIVLLCVQACNTSTTNQVNFVDLPERAKEGDRVTLTCKYDSKGARLHQLRWFLNGEEFVSILPYVIL